MKKSFWEEFKKSLFGTGHVWTKESMEFCERNATQQHLAYNKELSPQQQLLKKSEDLEKKLCSCKCGDK